MEREVQVVVTAIAAAILWGAARPVTPEEAVRLAADLLKEADRVAKPSQEVMTKMAEAAGRKAENVAKP